MIFYVVQRKRLRLELSEGAKSFGKGNFKALFEMIVLIHRGRGQENGGRRNSTEAEHMRRALRWGALPFHPKAMIALPLDVAIDYAGVRCAWSFQ
jgi:hypothetical protein